MKLAPFKLLWCIIFCQCPLFAQIFSGSPTIDQSTAQRGGFISISPNSGSSDLSVGPSMVFQRSLSGNSQPARILFNFKPTSTSNALTHPERLPEEPAYEKHLAQSAALTAGAVAVTAFLLHTDQQTYRMFANLKKQHKSIRTVSPVVSDFGDGNFSLALFGGFMGYSIATGNPRAFQTGKIGLESFLLSGVITQFLKHTFGRERPSTASQPGGKFHGPFAYFNQQKYQPKALSNFDVQGLSNCDARGLSNFDAFPSGHTATAFAAAATFADLYPQQWVSYAAYGTATAVAVSRITEDTHWASDVFVGALIGIFSTRLVEQLDGSFSTLSLEPQPDTNSFALKFSFPLF